MQVIDDAEAEYLSFFASKTVAMIRAPDTYVYPAPFNLVEIFFVAPLESVHSRVPLTRLANESFMQIRFEPINLREGKMSPHLNCTYLTRIAAQPFRHECPVLHPYGNYRALRVVLAKEKVVGRLP